MFIPHFVFPLICWWTSESCPHFGYCEQYWCEYGWTGICLSPCFQFLWAYTSEWNCRIVWFKFSSLRNCQTVFPNCQMLATSFYIVHQQCTRVQVLHILANTCYFPLFDNSHPNGCEMASSHGFDLHFPNV